MTHAKQRLLEERGRGCLSKVPEIEFINIKIVSYFKLPESYRRAIREAGPTCPRKPRRELPLICLVFLQFQRQRFLQAALQQQQQQQQQLRQQAQQQTQQQAQQQQQQQQQQAFVGAALQQGQVRDAY